jgi:hypothetical protein
MEHKGRPSLFLSVLLIVFAVLTAPAVRAEEDLSGLYAISGQEESGAAYGGELAIKRRGSAFDVTWQRAGSVPESGLGLTLNHVLGIAYWPNNEVQEPGIGTVIYRIDGGTLDGIWLPEGGYDRAPGREVLSGSRELVGRFQITLGINPGGRSHYTGYADLERSGDHFRIVWRTPMQVFVGSGIKIGSVLAVAYAYRHYPAIAAYCANGRRLEGFWWTGPDGRSGKETLSLEAESGAQLSTVPQLNPRDPCTTPVAANF